MKKFAEKYLSNTRLIILVILAIVISGLMSYFQLPRELMPSIKIPMMAIMATYPGANAADVEELVTNKMETALKSVKGIDEVTSTSSENVATVIVQFDEDVVLDDVYNEVSQKINRIRDFPTGVDQPQLFKVDFDSSPIWTFNLEGTDMIGLVNTAEDLKSAIEENSDIDRVDISGGKNREIQVVIDQQKVNELGINPQLLAQAVSSGLGTMPAGTVTLNDFQLTVSTDKVIDDLDTLRQTLVRVNGASYPLGELAAIMENEKIGSSHSYELEPGIGSDPIQTISLAVYKLAGRPIDKATQHAKASAEAFMVDYPEYKIRTGTDMGEEINKSFNDLMENIIATVVLVFIVMLLFLGFKEALISALCIPAVMFITYALMSVMGMSLNMISLMGLLLALGMLVDNAIVVVTALHRQYRQGGQTALQAAVAVWEEFFVAMVSTNLTTVWAFLPLLLMTGIMGDFMQPLPIIVTIAIIGSALVAFFVSLPLGIFILELKLPARVQKLIMGAGAIALATVAAILVPSNPIMKLAVAVAALGAIWLGARYYFARKQQNRPVQPLWQKIKNVLSHGVIDVTKLEDFYEKHMTKIVNNKKGRRSVIIAVIAITLLCYILPFTPAVTTEMMPGEPEPIVYLETEVSQGTQPEVVEAMMLAMLQEFKDYPAEVIDYISADVGQSSSQSMMSTSQSNKFLLTVHLHEKNPVTGEKIVPDQYAQEWRAKYENYAGGEVKVSQAQGEAGSFGADVQLSITGPESSVLDEQAEKIVAYLNSTGKVANIVKSTQEATSRISFVPDLQALQDYGVSQSEVNTWLRSTLSGMTLGQLKLAGQETAYDINFRFRPDTVEMTDLSQVMIPTSLGSVPLSSLGSFELRPNQSSIAHYNYEPSVTITADSLPGESGTEIGAALNKYVADELEMPVGYQTVTGGMNESFAESVNSLLIAMVVAFLLILTTLVLQLKSFRKAAIVMTVIPVAISGVFFIMALTGITLSIPSIIGILALFGIVVNNSILVVERINQNLAEKMPMTQSIIQGATSRLQPILMTSLTTIIGLAPLTVSDPMWRGLGGTIIAGLMFSGTLMLIFLPILYSMWFDPEKLEQKDLKWAAWKEKVMGIKPPELAQISEAQT